VTKEKDRRCGLQNLSQRKPKGKRTLSFWKKNHGITGPTKKKMRFKPAERPVRPTGKKNPPAKASERETNKSKRERVKNPDSRETQKKEKRQGYITRELLQKYQRPTKTGGKKKGPSPPIRSGWHGREPPKNRRKLVFKRKSGKGALRKMTKEKKMLLKKNRIKAPKEEGYRSRSVTSNIKGGENTSKERRTCRIGRKAQSINE